MNSLRLSEIEYGRPTGSIPHPAAFRQKGISVHAVVINVSMTDQAAAQAELAGLVPRVSALPGFVTAYWIALSPGKGTAIQIFDSEAGRGISRWP